MFWYSLPQTEESQFGRGRMSQGPPFKPLSEFFGIWHEYRRSETQVLTINSNTTINSNYAAVIFTLARPVFWRNAREIQIQNINTPRPFDASIAKFKFKIINHGRVFFWRVACEFKFIIFRSASIHPDQVFWRVA